MSTEIFATEDRYKCHYVNDVLGAAIFEQRQEILRLMMASSNRWYDFTSAETEEKE